MVPLSVEGEGAQKKCRGGRKAPGLRWPCHEAPPVARRNEVKMEERTQRVFLWMSITRKT